MATIKKLLESGEVKDINGLFKLGKKPTINELLEYAFSKSTCLKHKVGVVIETVDKRYVLGWNGPPEGMENYECLRKGCTPEEGIKKCAGICAETMAVGCDSKNGLYLEGGTMYLNEGFPCAEGAKSIFNTGIKKLVTPDKVYSNKKERTLVPELRNQPYNFEMSEELIHKANIKIIIDKSIKPIYKKNE